jgi:hypothetical protein
MQVDAMLPLSMVGGGFSDALGRVFRTLGRVSRDKERRPLMAGSACGGAPLLSLSGHTSPVHSVCVSVSVGIVVSASTVCLVHRLKDGRLLRVLDPWSSIGTSMSPHGDGSSVASGFGGVDGELRDAMALEDILGVRRYPTGVRFTRVLVLPDGQVVAAVERKLMLFSARFVGDCVLALVDIAVFVECPCRCR